MNCLAVCRHLGTALILTLALGACGGSGGASAPGGIVPQAGSQSFGARPQSVAAARSAALRGALRPALSAPLLPPPGTIYVGGFISPNQHESIAQQIASTHSFESTIGRRLAIDLHYYQWTDSFPGLGEADDAQSGRIPLISWHCGVYDADIAAGVYDSFLAARAAKIAAYGHPVFLRYKWEMNLHIQKTDSPCLDPATDNMKRRLYNPNEYIAAWDHIRSIFALNGASNVVWVWNPSSSGIDPGPYYPGSSEVDWIAFDRYDTTNGVPFRETFLAQENRFHLYPTFSTYNKPIMIGETGAKLPTQQLFLGGADYELQTDFPLIQAIVYWDSLGHRGDYRLLQSGIPAFIQFASGAYEQGYGP